MLMRSRLYVPGVRPRMIVTAGAFGADIVVLDLEDSVPPDEKDAARDLVREALGIVDFGRSAVFVRVNADEETMGEDLEVLGGPCDGILLPKCDDPLILEYLDDVLAERESELGRERGHFRIIPIIESARGLRQAYEIATATDRVAALTLGLQDLAVDLGMPRSDDEAMLLPRSQVVLASRAAGVPPLDSVHPAIEDEGALFEACVRSRQMGFEGRGAIHPSQVDVIHRAFMPP
ncbi:MAG TPA: CoA ester lyase, partial [Thermoplasmata archaeon]|nr:CoA ester lyase [Thermoplasmata archaeon]